MSEDPATRLKRLYMRSIRRGTKEMDLILGRFAKGLDQLDAAGLDAYERLLSENDNDLYLWVSGQAQPPDKHMKILDRITRSL